MTEIVNLSPKIRDASEVISEHLDAIKEVFKPGAKITVLVRRPGDDVGRFDFIMGDDDLQEAMNMIARRMAGDRQ